MKKTASGVGHILGFSGSPDGHRRFAKADQFTVIGGNEEVHEAMVEGLAKTAESLRLKGKNFRTAEPEEVKDLVRKHTPGDPETINFNW